MIIRAFDNNGVVTAWYDEGIDDPDNKVLFPYSCANPNPSGLNKNIYQAKIYTETIPVPPLFNGRLERWYASAQSCAANVLLGWSYVRFDQCLQDPGMFFVSISESSYPPFKLTSDGRQLLNYSSLDISCLGANTTDTHKPQYVDTCTSYSTGSDTLVCTVICFFICPTPFPPLSFFLFHFLSLFSSSFSFFYYYYYYYCL